MLVGHFLHQVGKPLQFGGFTHSHQLLLKLGNTLVADLLVRGQVELADGLAGRLLDRAQQTGLFLGNKQNRLALATSATGSTNTVNIGLVVVGNIVVDHMADALHIQAAGRHICGYHYIHLAFLQPVDGAFPQCLGQVAIEGGSGETAGLQLLGNLQGGGLGADKNNHAVKGFHIQDTGQGIHFLVALHHQVGLIDTLNGFGLGSNAHLLGITQVLVCHSLDLRWHSGGEQSPLAALRCLRENRLDIVDKAHTQHLVGLIQHQSGHFAQVETATAQMVQHTARGTHYYLSTALQSAELAANIGTAIDGQYMETLKMTGIALERFGHLDSQFTGRCQHQDLRSFLLAVQLAQHGQGKGRSFTCTGLGCTQQIATLQQHRNALGLDR